MSSFFTLWMVTKTTVRAASHCCFRGGEQLKSGNELSASLHTNFNLQLFDSMHHVGLRGPYALQRNESVLCSHHHHSSMFAQIIHAVLPFYTLWMIV